MDFKRVYENTLNELEEEGMISSFKIIEESEDEKIIRAVHEEDTDVINLNAEVVLIHPVSYISTTFIIEK